MLKNKFKIISIFAIIMLLFTIPCVMADNETEENTNSTTTEVTTNERTNK